jgi:N-acetylglucosamine kinase-like BadF-type ATPase
MSALVLGVDGGNTKTIALVAAPDGRVVGAGRAGCADIYGAPSFDAAIDEIAAAVRSALPPDARVEDVSTAVFSLAGADWDEDKTDLRAALSGLVPNAGVTVLNDAIGALRAGAPDGVGVSVVVGTGGCVGAASAGGREWHSSWWALHTGAWAIGSDALGAVYEAELGTAPPTALTEAALQLFEATTVEQVLHAFTRRGGRGSWEAALFAPAVLRLARDGDEVAIGITREHGARLGKVAQVAAQKVGLEPPFPLVLLGGVLRGEGAELIVDEIVSRLPEATPVRPSREPAVGALLAALDRAGREYDPGAVDATLPAADLFGTHPRGLTPGPGYPVAPTVADVGRSASE